MTYKFIAIEVRNNVCWIQFKREDKLNALNPHVLAELAEAVQHCEDSDEVRVLVLKGSAKAFMAGADIENMARGDINLAHRISQETNRVQNCIANLEKPTIAAISGYALGAGCEIALCCDFRIGAENTIMGLPEIKLGIIPGGGGTQRLPRLVGLGKALSMVLTGDMVPAPDALQMGLLDKVVSMDALESEVELLSQKLTKRPSVALRAAKQALYSGMNMSLTDGLKCEQELFAMLFGTVDQKEGMAAFLEKRKPVFQGK